MIDVRSLLLICGAPLPVAYQPKQDLVFPSMEFHHGYSISPEWMAFLSKQENAARDPLPKRFLPGGKPLFIWENCEVLRSMSESERAFTRHYFDYGLRHGAIAANPDFRAARFDALLLESGSTHREFESFADEINDQLDSAFSWFCEGIRLREVKQGLRYPRLTNRQRECITWTAAGLTTSDISNKLKIAESTVNEHIQSACGQLQATTRTQACARAQFLGEIQV